MAGFFFGGQPLSPEDEQKRREAIIAKALAEPATNVGAGLGQLGVGLAAAYQKQGEQFPQAPGDKRPTIGSLFGNLFTARNNGGLY